MVGFLLRAEALGAFLAGSILTGQLLSVTMINSGGAWDNAKKMIEDGLYGGKGSDAHKASVVGDTVGDPLKDTSGPSLNILLKVMNLVAILILPLLIKTDSLTTYHWLLIFFLALVLAYSLWKAQKQNLSS